jgi:hypothetical protein
LGLGPLVGVGVGDARAGFWDLTRDSFPFRARLWHAATVAKWWLAATE